MLKLCLSARASRAGRWWYITASLGLWVRSRLVTIMWLSSHKDMFVPSYLRCCVSWRKRSQNSVLWLTLPWVWSKTFSAQRNRPASVFTFCQPRWQHGDWDAGSPWPAALLSHRLEKTLGLLAMLFHPERVPCSFLAMGAWEKAFKMYFKYS